MIFSSIFFLFCISSHNPLPVLCCTLEAKKPDAPSMQSCLLRMGRTCICISHAFQHCI